MVQYQDCPSGCQEASVLQRTSKMVRSFCTLNVSNGKLECLEKKRAEAERFKVGVSADEDQSDKDK